MKDSYKRAGKRTAAVAAAVCCVSLAVGHLSLEDLSNWGKTAAMLSVGMLQPEGGAQALSERLDRTPDKGAAATTGQTASTSRQTDVTSTAPATSGTSATTGQTTAAPGTVPTKGPKGGIVKELKMSLGANPVQGVAIKNSSGKTFDIAKELGIKPNIQIKNNSKEPQVLLVHTHTTEAYMAYYAGYYNEGDGGRSKDESKNVCAVGEAIAAELRAAGIGVIHDTTIHDNPKYTGAYTRSEQTVKKNLEKYPSIKVVLDVHRDGIMIDDTTKAKPTVVIDGKKAAQTMIIVGAVSTTALPHPNWQDNFHFALQLQKAAVASHPGLMRPVSVVGSRYNQHLSRGYLLVEMGSEGNTLDEAVYSGHMLGKTLGEVLQQYKS